ncbi:transposable element Tc1 transposase [Trichonephila clavipes]|nr:transposable element Tc1 transposase [Trichonephila clavipes]
MTKGDDRHLRHMAVNNRTASSRQLAVRWSTATGVLMLASSISRRLRHRGLRARVLLYRIPLTANHRQLRLQWAPEPRAWQADWHPVVFSDESRFNLWDHDGNIRVRRYACELCLPEGVIERHSGITPGVMVWGAISYHERSNLLRIEGNLNSKRYVCEVPLPEVIPFIQGIPGAIFQQDNIRSHVAKTVRDFCSAQHMQLLPWPASLLLINTYIEKYNLHK